MKVLMICNKSPYPAKEGGSIAMNAIIEGLLKSGHTVKVLAINTNKYFTDVEDVPTEYQKNTGLEFGYVDLSVKAVDAFQNLFTNKSYHVQRFINKDFEHLIKHTLEENQYDVVQLETLFMAPYVDVIRKNSKAKIVLRAHNIEHLIWSRIARSTEGILKRKYIKHLARTLKIYELNILKEIDGIAAITHNDAVFFKEQAPDLKVVDIPFGVDADKYESYTAEGEFPSLCHIGAMNWIPNQEGIEWFLKNVWDQIHVNHPALHFYLAGREMPDHFYKMNYANVDIVGEVPDALEFIQSKSIMVVPLLSGSGIRVKIIEGMAMGKAVIASKIGAEGINYTDGVNILIANTPEEYAQAIKKCVNDQQFTEEIGRNARKLIRTEHHNAVLMEKLTAFYQSL
ncbi:MAG: glycosyltransferase [Bacteroidales bacterium]|nr:glycosyltransferase [Bacteroidales bacterium]